MDLPTYTNIWRIEKRLYKLYDLRLPMPLPLVQIGVFIGVFVPWIVMLQLVGLPFHAPWHVVYLVPPGVLTWLATRPVIEGKRLTELLISQVRYLTEARTWARLTPIHEPAEVVIVGRVWRRGRMSGRRVHAARPAPQAARSAAPQRVPALPVGEGAAPAEWRAAAQRHPGAPPVRAAIPHRPPAPGLRATPRDGIATPPAVGGRRPDPARPDQAGPERTRPERTRPERTRPERTRPERTRPETIRPEVPRPARPAPGTPLRAPGLPPTPGPAVSAPPASPASPAAAGAAAPSERPGQAVPAASGPSAAAPSAAGDATVADRPATGERHPGGTRRAVRPRNTSHEADGPVPAPGRASPPVLSSTGTAPAGPGDTGSPSRPEGPAATRRGPETVRPGEPVGRHAAPPAPRPARPDTPAVPRQGQDGGPGRPPAASAAGPASPSAASPAPTGAPRPSPTTPSSSPPAGRRPGTAERSGSTAQSAAPGRADGPAGPEREGAPRPPGRADEAAGTPPARVVPFTQGRHAKPSADAPAGASHAAGERPGPARSAQEPAAAGGGPALSDEERRIAQARTDQIAWPGADRRRAAPAGGATGPSSSGRPPAPGRGRAHGDETPAQRPPAAPARDIDAPAAAWTPPAPPRRPAAPAAPAVPSRAPGAPGSQTPSPGRAAPVRGDTQQPAAPPQARPTAPARPATPSRTGAPSPVRGPADTETAEPSPARAVRSGPASPVRPGPMPQLAHDDDGRDVRGLRRIFSGGGHGDGDYEERVRTAFAGARRVVVLGCTGGAGQTVTALMLGHTFAQQRGDRIVAVDVNPGPGAMARRTRTETRETLTSLITHAEQVTGYQMMRRYTSISKSGLEVIAAGKNPVQALDDRDYALAMRTLDRFYSITLLDAAAAVVARVLPYADQIVLVAPASSDAPRAVAMTFEWLDGHGYEDLRARAVTVINGVSRRSMDDVEQAESVARGRCRALVRIPWDDHLSLDRAPRNELRSLRAPTRKAYIALGGVVAGGFVQVPDRYPQQEVTR